MKLEYLAVYLGIFTAPLSFAGPRHVPHLPHPC
jgi:hypothetical protein